MHDHKLVVVIGALRVGVTLRGGTVGGPASVGNADVYVVLMAKVQLLATPNCIFQSLHLALRPDNLNVTVVLIKGDT